MYLGGLTLLLAAIVVVCLNSILLLGAAGRDLNAPAEWLGGLVVVLDVSLGLSSVLLGIKFASRDSVWLSCVFFGNVLLLVVAFVLRRSGFSFSPALLFGADLYWLNLYLIVLARYGRRILRGK